MEKLEICKKYEINLTSPQFAPTRRLKANVLGTGKGAHLNYPSQLRGVLEKDREKSATTEQWHEGLLNL